MVAPSESLAEADWRRTLELNLTAYFLLSQEIGRRMIAQGRGSIINVSSVNGSVAFPQRLAYCVSKAGVDMMTQVLAIEWARHGVLVNSIAPGYVETEMVQGLAAPEEVAGAALYLASDEATYVTGTVVTVDGAWSAYGYV